MRIIVVGLNEQGLQWQQIFGVATVALVRTIQEVPSHAYDAVIICTAQEHKYAVARFALSNRKHVLVAAPLWAANVGQLVELEQLAVAHNVVLHTAHLWRLLPEVVRVQQAWPQLGEIYHCRVAHAGSINTRQNGALLDLGPHLLYLLSTWFGSALQQHNFNIVYKDQFNRHVVCADFNARCTLEIAAHFFAQQDQLCAEIYGAKGQLQIACIVDATCVHGLMVQELQYFQSLCVQVPAVDCSVEQWIYAEVDRLLSEEVFLA